MPIVTPSPALERWLADAADAWTVVSDRRYRDLVAQWHAVFGVNVDRGDEVQGPRALQEFEAELPATVFLFNGVSVSRAANSTTRNPHAYQATGLRRVDRPLANELDLVLVDAAFSFCCVCTHEWQGLAHPIFARRAA